MSDRIGRVWERIDPHRLRQTFLQMLDIYSPSGKEEDIQLYLESVLQGAGLSVEREEVEEDRYNLRVALGAAEPEFYLVGHVDTISAWDLEEFGPREEEGVVHGLGSADMKGGCAAMVETWLAMAGALAPEERPAAGLLLVVGEEETGDGSARFLQEHRPQWVVIGEPTGLAACFSHYGYLEANFLTRGRRIHSSLPELGHNAVESMLRALLHLAADPLFERESSGMVYSIRELSSSRAGFVVPDRCEATIDLHLPPAVELEAVERVIRGRAASAGNVIPDLDLTLDFDFASQGYDLGADHSPARTLERIYPKLGLPLRFEAFRSHSDGNLFFQAGVNPLILGPGSLETAHTPQEQASLAEVAFAAQIYAALCLGEG
jgi:acetylornithine deacetylase